MSTEAEARKTLAAPEAWIRAWRNRFIDERMNAYPNDEYELRRAKAEADANEFEEAFAKAMMSGVRRARGKSDD